MLSEEEKKELLQAAASESLRRDFEIMRQSALKRSRAMDLDQLIVFLTGFGKVCDSDVRMPRRAGQEYTKPLI